MLPRSLRHRSPLLWLVVSFVAGLVCARCGLGLPRWPALIASFGLAAASLCFVTRKGIAWPTSLCLALVLAGDVAYLMHQNRLVEWETLPSREARLTLRVDRVFSSNSATRYAGLATIQEAELHLRDLVGQRIYFSLPLEPRQRMPLRSSWVRTVGVLQKVPLHPLPRSFDQYLVDGGLNFRLSRGRVLDVVKEPAPYYRFCAEALAKMCSVLGDGIEETRPGLAGVYRAMLLGQQHEMTEEQNQLFRQTGTMHLFAISGLHITVIAAAIHGVLSLLRLPSAPKYILCMLLLWLYVDITGGAPSAVRSFIMVALLETALLFRRPINALASLSAATVAVMVVTPLQVFGASFLMSYGIVAVLILMAGPLAEEVQARWQPYRDLPRVTLTRFQTRLQDAWRTVLIALAAGACASLVGLVTGVMFFGMLTPGSLAVNLILIPVSSYVLMTGFCSLLAGGLWFSGACVIFNNAGALILLFMEWLARSSVSLPGMFYQRDFLWHPIGGLALLGILSSCLVGYSKRWTWKLGGYLPPVIFAAIALLATSQRP